jgi:hypothetical protein
MNSASVSDAGCSAVASTLAAPPSLPGKEKPTTSFGAALDEASAEPQDSAVKVEDSSDATPANESEPSETKGKKKQEDTTLVAAFVCACPPPTIDPTPVPPKAKQGADQSPPVSADPPALPALPNTSPITRPQSPAPDQILAETVAPKTTTQAPKSPHRITNSGRVALDPKLFQPTVDEPLAASMLKIESAKLPQAQAPPVTNASHGTLVAQLENRVKNSEKSAEIAPVIEQKMPVRDVLRRAVAELNRVESFHADKSSRLQVSDFDVAPAEVVPVKSLEAAHLVESIRTEVASLRQRGDSTMTVVLRPDNATQLAVDVSIARDGTVHAVARCERGDFQSLHTQWPQLQQSLAAHGIRVADLSNSNQSNNNSPQHDHRSGGAFQNFDRNENPRRRDQSDLANFEEQFTASRNKFSQTKTQPQPATPVPATRRWQSWA